MRLCAVDGDDRTRRHNVLRNMAFHVAEVATCSLSWRGLGSFLSVRWSVPLTRTAPGTTALLSTPALAARLTRTSLARD